MKEFKFKIGSQSYSTSVSEHEDGVYEVVVNGKTYHVEVPETKSDVPVRPAAAVKPVVGSAPKAAAQTSAVTAPLPGTITRVVATEGATVKKGDVLVVMEAMKMANDIVAESDGVVGKIHVAAGQSVNQGDVLVEFVGAAPAAPAAAPAPVAAPAAPAAKAPVATASSVTSPLPGTVSKVLVKVGDAVKSGQTVAVVEAMKMQNDIVAESDGTVKAVCVSEGSQVQGGDVLVELA